MQLDVAQRLVPGGLPAAPRGEGSWRPGPRPGQLLGLGAADLGGYLGSFGVDVQRSMYKYMYTYIYIYICMYCVYTYFYLLVLHMWIFW